MDDTEKELRRIFEDTTTNNVNAILNHANKTRNIVKTLENKIALLENNLIQANEKIEDIRKLLTNIQVKIYNGGTV